MITLNEIVNAICVEYDAKNIVVDMVGDIKDKIFRIKFTPYFLDKPGKDMYYFLDKDGVRFTYDAEDDYKLAKENGVCYDNDTALWNFYAVD